MRGDQAFAPRWQYVVMNRSLLSESNGEHWLLVLLPPTPFIPRYTIRAERHDLGCIYVGVSHTRLFRSPTPIRNFTS